jgi:DNA-binding transcriptional LysR family regulator
MLDLNDFRYLVEVVDRGGFSAAARSLERPTSTISWRIQQLERDLGLTLLVRTSRRVTLTDAGEEFYSHAVAMLDRANEAEEVMRGRLTEPAGTVRYSVAIATAEFGMADMICSFLARYPKIELVAHVSDQSVDIVADRYDFAIRAHSVPLPNSALVQRSLADAPWYLLASPDYLQRFGTPRLPIDLSGHQTLFVKRDNAPVVWRMRHETGAIEPEVITLKPRVHCACMVTLKRGAETGLGIVALPAFTCRAEMRDGRLKRVLPEWVAADSTISVLMPNRRGMSAAARAFFDHIVTEFPEAMRLP